METKEKQTEEKEIKQVDDIEENNVGNDFSNLFNISEILKLKKLIVKNDNAPTHTPKSFQEQFYFQTGNLLWVFMSGTWVRPVVEII